jgi:hypothetical protein
MEKHAIDGSEEAISQKNPSSSNVGKQVQFGLLSYWLKMVPKPERDD